MTGFYRMTPEELAWGWLPGYTVETDPRPDTPSGPVEVLSGLLETALRNPPCLVEFSGGRDSSVLLALATRIASAEHLQPPVPVTRLFSEVPESREDEWQEKVIRHVGLKEWVRLEHGEESDLLGPLAQESLRAHGVVWPPSVHTRGAVWRMGRGGVIVTGEGGDEILGPRRITPIAGLLAGNVHPRWEALARSIGAAAPRTLRRWIDARRDRDFGERAWLRPATRERLRRCLADDALSEPMAWDRSLIRHLRRRANRIGVDNLRWAARLHATEYVAPLLDPAFVVALSHTGGRLGFPGRTAALERLFGGLLPPEILHRQSKAEFVRTAFGPHSRDFADGWDGGGVDQSLVDPQALGHEWQSVRPHAGTLPLLQAAWLASVDDAPVDV